jgi:sigma-B regulation protein RsbU (phosphoserine phosphatase)
VGGDLYDFFIDGDRLYFVIGDVSGKGVPASLFMAIARSLFRTLAQQVTSPAEIMTKMNHSIAENNEANMFITLIIGILDLKTGSLRFCNAGHNPPVIIGVDGKSTLLQSKIQLFVGILEDMEYTDEEIILEKGSRLFLYTDGVTEAENTSKELYGEDRLLSTLAPLASCDIRIVVDTVIRSIASHVQEAEASDDMTILLIHYEPNITKV